MKKWLITMVGIVFLVGTLSCKNDNNNETKTATLTGYVYLSDTIPAPGVHIYDKVSPSYSGYTDRNGFFKISVPAGARTIMIDGGIFKKEISVSLSEGELRELYTSSSPFVLLDSTEYKIAVKAGLFDSIQNIFDQIGIHKLVSVDDSGSGYVLYNADNFPTDIETLRKFTLLAFNCGPLYPHIGSNILKEYVQSGGNIYASDWQFWVMDSLSLLGNKVFLHSHDGDYATGNKGTVQAKVVDDILKSQIGKDSVTIVFDIGSWVVIDSVKPDIKVLLSANVVTSDGANIQNAPLSILAKPSGNDGGELLYTSFHYEAQATSEDVLEMLKMFLVRIGQD